MKVRLAALPSPHVLNFTAAACLGHTMLYATLHWHTANDMTLWLLVNT